MAVHRAYNQSFVENGVFYKCSQEERLADESYYYDQIPYLLKPRFPRKLEFTDLPSHYVLALEHIECSNLGEEFLQEDDRHHPDGSVRYLGFGLSEAGKWEKIGEQILIFIQQMQEFQWERPETLKAIDKSIGTKALREMYVDKTLTEFQKLVENPMFAQWESKETIEVNGQRLLTFSRVWERLAEAGALHILLSPENYRPTMIHGDFCFSNMLSPKKRVWSLADVMFVDPRGRFGRRGIWGDTRYDMAKLKHSLDGKYEAIILDKFQLGMSLDGMQWEFTIPTIVEERREAFAHVFERSHRWKPEHGLIEGLIFIGMCARHYDSIQRQAIMYGTGLQRLNAYISPI